MRNLPAAITAVMLAAFTAHLAAADIAPNLVNYQGRLTDEAGNPVEGVVSMIFTIYGSATGDDIIWQETHGSVQVEDGLFTVSLGEGDTPTPVDDEVFSSSERWLGVKVGAAAEISPRTRLVSVPYSQRVSTVDQAEAGVMTGTLELQQAVAKQGLAEAAKLIIRGELGDSVVISPGEDIGLKVTDDEGDDAVLITGGSSGGALVVTSSDAAKAAGQVLGSVEIAPAQNVVLRARDADNDDAVLITADDNGGTILVTASDAAKNPNQVLRTVEISPDDNVVLKATEANQDDVVLITANETGGAIVVTASDAAKASPNAIVGSVIINENGIFVVNDQTSDTTLAITVEGDIVGDGQIAMGENSSNTGEGSSVLGLDNTASGNHSTVAGGQFNDVQSDYSAILGGYGDTILATANYSYLFGIGSTLSADSTFMVAMPHIRFGDEAGGYEFPALDGANGQVLVSDGAGRLLWTTPNFGNGDGDIWARDGNTVALQYISDSVGIGMVDPTEKLDVEGNIHASGSILTGNSLIVDGLANEIATEAGLTLRADQGLYITDGGSAPATDPDKLINTSTGAYLSSDGMWVNAYSPGLSEDITAPAQSELLEKLALLPIKRWTSADSSGAAHIGPLGEDLLALFGVGDGQSVSSVDPAGIALAAIKALYQMTLTQQRQLQQIAELEAQVAELEALKVQMAELRSMVQTLAATQN